MFAHAFGTSSHSPDVLLSVPTCLAAGADTERCVGDLSPLPSVTPLQAPRGRGPPPTNDRVVSPVEGLPREDVVRECETFGIELPKAWAETKKEIGQKRREDEKAGDIVGH